MTIGYIQKVTDGVRRLAQLGNKSGGFGRVRAFSEAFARLEVSTYFLYGVE